jgi:hypothetical protein
LLATKRALERGQLRFYISFQLVALDDVRDSGGNVETMSNESGGASSPKSRSSKSSSIGNVLCENTGYPSF